LAEQIEVGPTVHAALQQLELVDLALGLAVAPVQLKRGLDRCPVFHQTRAGQRSHQGIADPRRCLERRSEAERAPLQRLDQVLVGWAAGEVPLVRAFSDGLPPNRAGLFPGTRLSRASTRDALPRGTPRVDGDVAILAGDQSLPLARGHLLHPGRDRATAMSLEVLQVTHVMDLHTVV
jgi:hypothetical protein